MIYNAYPFHFSYFDDVTLTTRQYVAYLDLEFEVNGEEVQIIDAQVVSVQTAGEDIVYPNFLVLDQFHYDKQYYPTINRKLRKAARSWK